MSLVARYKLNDLGTLLVDDTGNGNDLTNINGVGVVTDPTYGIVSSFNNTSTQRLQLDVSPPAFIGASSHTISFWMKVTDYSTAIRLIYGHSTGNPYRVQIHSGTQGFITRGALTFELPLGGVDTTQWVYYTITYDGTTEKVYFNGALAGQQTVAQDKPSGIFQIGGGEYIPDMYAFYGVMTDFRIYDDALSAAETSSVYNDGPNPDPVPTVNWVQDGNGNYEISSPEHLKQLMNKGSLYSNSGSAPTSYWANGTNYIQTADIDLLSDSTDIKPIGNSLGEFQGDYDGGNYSISNWSYLDPNFTSTGNCEIHVGLFGFTRENVLQNIRLTGIFDLKGYHQSGGFLAGHSLETDVSNIMCNFNPGTNMTRGDATSNTVAALYSGCIMGFSEGTSVLNKDTMTGIEVKGTVDFVISGKIINNYPGGIFGYLFRADASLINNSATLSGMNGSYCAGIVAWVRDTNLSNCINAMTGDITGSIYTGGIVGIVTDTNSITNIVNSMTGNITNTSTGTASGVGGILGLGETDGTYEGMFNYMTGNITGINPGGIFGRTFNSPVVANSINAMNGNVHNAVLGFGIINGSVTINTDFGLIFTSNRNTTTIPPTGFLELPGFPLPYFEISGTDTIGNSYDYDFVFANLGGNNTYSETHLIISGGVGTFQDGAILLTLTLLEVTPLVSSTNIVIVPVTGAIAYRLTSQITGFPEITVRDNFTELMQSIGNLIPSTEYTIRVYSTEDGSVYTLVETVVTNTLANIPINYDKNDYLSNGIFDITGDELVLDLLDAVFDTGDIIGVNVSGKPMNSTFVNGGDTLDVTDTESVLAPFLTDGGSGQNVLLTLSDTSIVSISYDETSEEVTIDGATTHSAGDSFVLDGKKVTIINI